MKPEEGRPTTADERGPRRLVRSEELLAGAREVVIVHNGEEYRLQVTRNGKLILIK